MLVRRGEDARGDGRMRQVLLLSEEAERVAGQDAGRDAQRGLVRLRGLRGVIAVARLVCGGSERRRKRSVLSLTWTGRHAVREMRERPSTTC